MPLLTSGDEKPLLQWMGKMLARFVGLVFILYGLLMLVGNLVDAMQGAEYSAWWVLPWILIAGAGALAGGVVFMLSIDRAGFMTRRWRGLGVGLMLFASVLPTTLTAAVGLLALLMIPSIWIGLPRVRDEAAATAE